ncbi:rhodanese-like domain-containing protein [Phenylobacterium sp. LjRoot164]|uniref:sulfurtransferase n=1 Tax=unclassified Phenylobacterium TaxID=2640670 RepID=UPI003ED00388
MSRSDVLISAAELKSRPDVVLIDVGPREGRDVGLAGAVPADLGADFAGAGGGDLGSRPLPQVADLQARVRRWGVNAGDLVVVYDDKGGLQAARAWWTLRWAGLSQVRLLDGGLQAAQAAALPLGPLAERSGPQGDAELSAGHLPVLDADGAAGLASAGRLLDARGAAPFKGDEAARTGGHIPGSVNLPAAGNLGPDGLFLSDEALASRYAAWNDGLGVSCGSGVSAAHAAAALAILGKAPALYVASWSGWSSDPRRPVAYG